MDTQPWHKFYPNKLAVLLEHPNFMLGCWLRIWCVLANSKTRWTKEGSVDMWSRIIGERPAETKRFINYMTLHMSDIKVVARIGADHKPIYSITELFYMNLEAGRKVENRIRKTAGRSRSEVTINREVIKKRIKMAYPPQKSTLQPAMFKKELAEVMCDASRAFVTPDDKINAENDKCQEILKYLAWLKTTPEWKDQDGKYIQGLGNWIQSRPWETDPRPNEKRELVVKDEIIRKIQEHSPQ